MNPSFNISVLCILFVSLFISAAAQVPPPTNLTASQYSGPLGVIAVELNWQAPQTPIPIMFKYNIYRKNGSLNEPGLFEKKYSNVMQTNFLDMQVSWGNTYSYYVTTVSPAGESLPSNKVQINLTNNSPFGIIAGVVINDSNNQPIRGAKVFFVSTTVTTHPNNAGFVFITNNLGEFRAVLPPATYLMKTFANGFVPEYYNNVTNPQQATPIVLNNADSIFVSVGLTPIVPTPSATISGLVTSDVTGNPIKNAKIKFIPTIVSPVLNYVAFTDSSGMFSKTLPPGSYYLRIEALGYVPEFYNNAQNIQQATIVNASPGSTVFVGNIGLTPLIVPTIYTLSGNVSDSLGNPLRAVVTVYPLRANSHLLTPSQHSALTDSLGNYTIYLWTRQNDTVVVYCRPRNPNFLPEFYNNKRSFADADRIVITGNITGIDFVLERKPIFANGISGAVMDTLGNSVMAHITAFPKMLMPIVMPPRKIYHTNTDSLGNYLFTNMLPNKYILLANPEYGYLPTFFRYDGMPTMNRLEADSVVVTETGIVTGINFIVRAASFNGYAEITGTVKDNSGNKISGAYILIYDNQQQLYSFAISDINGMFKVEGVAPGYYTAVADRMGYTCDQSFPVLVDYLNNANTTITFTLTPEGITSLGNNEISVKDFKLYQNYPNPFNPSTKIKYSVAERTNVKLSIYNIVGSEVVTLVNELKNPGEYEVVFDASNPPNGSKALSSGVYFYKIEAGNYKATKKLILMR